MYYQNLRIGVDKAWKWIKHKPIMFTFIALTVFYPNVQDAFAYLKERFYLTPQERCYVAALYNEIYKGTIVDLSEQLKEEIKAHELTIEEGKSNGFDVSAHCALLTSQHRVKELADLVRMQEYGE